MRLRHRLPTRELADWLVRHELGPLAYGRCKAFWPELAALLREDVFSAAAENSLHFDSLGRILGRFHGVGIPVVLLKGAALAQHAYGADTVQRTMSDIDLWVRAEDMAHAFSELTALGFRARGREHRPPELQKRSGGEIQLYRPDWMRNPVELHWSPFPGWWVQRTAAVDEAGIWARKEPLPSMGGEQLVIDPPQPPPPSYQLAAEDMVIQLAAHLVVNHQFGISAVRNLMDIVRTARVGSVDWNVVVKRATSWRVGTAVWLALTLADSLIGLQGAEQTIDQLRPSLLRRMLLRWMVSTKSVLAGIDFGKSRRRYFLLLLLVDRPRDMVKLVYRTVWPEGEWLEARYQGQGSHWRHLWQVVRHGRI